VVKAYEKAYATAGKQPLTNDTEVIGKESLNLVVCIAELYNLEVVSCVLIYDIVHALLKEGMGELEVELLLKILRSASTFLITVDLTENFCSLGSTTATR
jgi:nucleolar MIF4G domain-containing protein 1